MAFEGSGQDEGQAECSGRHLGLPGREPPARRSRPGLLGRASLPTARSRGRVGSTGSEVPAVPSPCSGSGLWAPPRRAPSQLCTHSSPPPAVCRRHALSPPTPSGTSSLPPPADTLCLTGLTRRSEGLRDPALPAHLGHPQTLGAWGTLSVGQSADDKTRTQPAPRVGRQRRRPHIGR